jgi:ABC-type multidrug transport system fused ATPase/permease subunit
VLFAGSNRENVTWGREDLGDDTVAAALVAAGAGFVLDLPKSLDTIVAEGGGSLSGGERQRIALARALCGTMRLLILDEATSAMDVETEAAVMAAVVALRGRTTILSVSHRLSTVRDADEIIVLDCGSIVERGRFEGLLAQGGRFSALWNAPSGTGYAEGRVLRVP